MKYAVTFCLLDQKAGSNPFWHSCLLLSQWQEEGGKMEVVDQWGFYGLPTTTPDSLLKKIKLKLHLDVDLNGNHGMLQHEALRFLDLGHGLHGATFKLSEEKFKLLQQRCQTMATEQEQAINEVMKQQGLAEKAKKDTRIYPYEHWSAQIYEFEKAKAKEQGREPRLKPFELNLSLTFWGPSLKTSHTCKSQLLSLLQGILTDKQINRLTENGKHPTIPCRSGPLEDIFLHSTGPRREHKNKSGKTVYYRSMEDKDVKLYWTFPPQEMEEIADESNNMLQVSKEYCDEAKAVIRKLQRLEWLFINADLPMEYHLYRDKLVEQIYQYYDAFAQINTMKSIPEPPNTWLNYFYFLGSVPRDNGEKVLLKNIKQAKELFNALYLAIVDGWEIDLNCPWDCDETSSNNTLKDKKIDSDEYINPLEAIAAYLSQKDKEKACSIIGRPYVYQDKEISSPNWSTSMAT
ncbi:hypothetical protein ACNVED_03405 [Legionella sp. D16C41]|uniref:hypothetical protein n=1 Tax=Legionella sp. D16C41 TaxID=3402688 RepID=UPI003AF761FD